ncbi:hypothetical protein Csa_010279 [Cucumis sativus]|nr:hypothetical protein Csa_010279 [Cucumis sativus]
MKDLCMPLVLKHHPNTFRPMHEITISTIDKPKLLSQDTKQLKDILAEEISKIQVIKVADFGVARVLAQSGVMTAETGTYRWMAPEVIEHKPYDHKADVYSFGIVLWELLTGSTGVHNFMSFLSKNISRDEHSRLVVYASAENLVKYILMLFKIFFD